MMKLRYLPLLLCATLGHLSHAAQTQGKVTAVGQYGTGDLYARIDTTINEAGCANNGIQVIASNPQVKSYLSLFLAAQASGKAITISTTGCLGSWPTLDTSYNSLVYINTN